MRHGVGHLGAGCFIDKRDDANRSKAMLQKRSPLLPEHLDEHEAVCPADAVLFKEG